MKRRLLAFLRVSERPDPPPGSLETLRIFQPSRRYLYYSVARWLPGQIGTFLGLVASLAFLGALDSGLIPFGEITQVVDFLADLEIEAGSFTANGLFLVNLFEILAVGTFLVQLVVSAFLLKLSWETRWYMVGDEAIRIRHGLWNLREQTMSIKNIQNLSIRQGPIQRLFGISDLEVRTAGGGSSDPEAEAAFAAIGIVGALDENQHHIGHFVGVDDAEEIRQHLRSRLVRVKGTGLGDDEDDDDAATDVLPGSGGGSVSAEVFRAAQSLRDEARALRRALIALVFAVLLVPFELAHAEGEPAAAPTPTEPTTVILVRHAEKVSADEDAELSNRGRRRAEELAHVLGGLEVDAIYSTPFKRTRHTAAPLAEALGLEVAITPIETTIGDHIEEMVRRIRTEHHGETVVVVGHSNTVPLLLRQLGVDPPPEISEIDYDNLFFLVLSPGRPPHFLPLRYGDETLP